MSRPSQQSNSDAFRRDAPREYIIPYGYSNRRIGDTMQSTD